MRYLITFSYDGSKFKGYQKQPRLKTVQGEIEKALKTINGDESVAISGSGRTDAGVHAINQKAHFDLDVDITCEKLQKALNSLIGEILSDLSLDLEDELIEKLKGLSKYSYVICFLALEVFAIIALFLPLNCEGLMTNSAKVVVVGEEVEMPASLWDADRVVAGTILSWLGMPMAFIAAATKGFLALKNK